MTEIYVKLKRGINVTDQVLDELKIDVDYQKGGINYFNGNIEKRGIYIVVKPCRRHHGIVSTMICGNRHANGYKVLIRELGRKSQKQIDFVADKVMPFAEKIADLYSEEKHNEIYDLIKSRVV